MTSLTTSVHNFLFILGGICIVIAVGGPIQRVSTPPPSEVGVTKDNVDQSGDGAPPCDTDVLIQSIGEDNENIKINCSQDVDLLVKRSRTAHELWKKKLIMGCTIAVAFEIVLIFVIVYYWKQLKVTFSKFTCPCDSLWFRRDVASISVASQNGRYTSANIQVIHVDDTPPATASDVVRPGSLPRVLQSIKSTDVPSREPSPVPGTSGTSMRSPGTSRHCTGYPVRYSTIHTVDTDDSFDSSVTDDA